MRWHIVEGTEGCDFAKTNRFTAVVVDALRASATAAMLLHAGATAIRVVKTVEEALALKQRLPEALLYGERHGLPPAGFDYGNSPRECAAAKGREVIFTTTNGAQRLVEAWGVPALLMGTTTNATAVAGFVSELGRDAVLIPAGPPGPDANETQEDWVAAVAIVESAAGEVGEGREAFDRWQARMREEGIPKLFETAPHAQNLRDVDLWEDVGYCARIDLTTGVPIATAFDNGVVTLHNA